MPPGAGPDEANRQAAEQAKWSEALAKETTRETAQLEEQLKREQEQVAAIGLTKEAGARWPSACATKPPRRPSTPPTWSWPPSTPGPMADSYRAAAEEARKQADLLGKRAENRVDGANREAAADTAKHWEKISDDIERSLTDSLYRGFESGKGFGQSFVDAIQNTLKTTVLKMVIQAYVEPVTKAAQPAGAFWNRR
jgi:molecular chaperone GrpE (heat shock protein)